MTLEPRIFATPTVFILMKWGHDIISTFEVLKIGVHCTYLVNIRRSEFIPEYLNIKIEP